MLQTERLDQVVSQAEAAEQDRKKPDPPKPDAPERHAHNSDPTMIHLRVFSVTRPNPILHFAPFLSTHFFPCLNPKFKNGSFLSVALVFALLGKKIDLAPTPSSSLAQTTTIELPECQERRGAKTT